MHHLKVAALLIGLCISGCTSLPAPGASSSAVLSSAPSHIAATTRLSYATKGGQNLQLDLVLPDPALHPGKRPVIIHSVGGGWETADLGDRATTEYLQHFASLGYVALAIDYRLAVRDAKRSGGLTPANARDVYLRAIHWGVEDLYDATAFVVQNAEAWNIDPARIVISGSSAGATNSLVAEFNLANATGLAAGRLPADFRYAGVISMAGAFWLDTNTPLVWKQRPAPIMFIHGGKDQLVTYEADEANSAYGPVYAQREFQRQGYPSWFIDLPEADHVIAFAGAIDYNREIEAFLTKMVWGKQQLTIHMVEHGQRAKTLGNLAELYRPYLPPELLSVLDAAKP